MARLTHARIKALREPGRYCDGGGLYLRIAPGGSKQWVLRVTINGTRRDIGLGGWPLTSLAEAREKAFINRKVARDGGDPLADKRRGKAPTFRKAAEATFEANRGRWRNDKTAKTWHQQLERHAFAILGDLPVNRIGREHVLRVLSPIWTTRPEVARKLRSRLRAVLAWAQAHGHVEHNIVDAVAAALPPQPAVAAHYAALPFEQVPDTLRTVDANRRASVVARAVFRFMVLTACRVGEVRGATWNEIDMDAATWTIPAERMKAKREHRVPLSDAALAVLEDVLPLRDASELVFPSPSKAGRPLSNMTITKLLRDAKIEAVPHGFRTSFRTWAAEQTNADHAVMELCLAHQVGNAVERAYARSDLFAKRRRLMEQWAAFLTDAAPAKVVSFKVS